MKQKPKRVALWSIVVLSSAFVLSALSPLAAQMLIQLPFGWLKFLQRVAPRASWNWSGIGMAVLCSLLIVSGTQWLCRWLYAHLHFNAAGDVSTRWRWSWSFALYGMLWSAFFAIMGTVGVAHQVGWLLNSKEPLYVARPSPWEFTLNLRTKAIDLTSIAESESWDFIRTRALFYEQQALPGTRMRPNGIEDVHVLFLEGQRGKLAAAVFFYRDMAIREKTGIVLTTPSSLHEQHSFRELPELLAKYRY
jgi:hypothetical protein